MKIRFIEDTYIRKVPKTRGNKPLGTMHLNAEIEVEPDTVKGEALQGNDRWYRDKNSWYYWSGRTEIVAPPAPKPPETSGGMIVSLAHPQEIAAQADPSVPLVTPPLANDDASWKAGEIPEGETRLVPPLESLLDVEKQSNAKLFGGIPSILSTAPASGIAAGSGSSHRTTPFPPPADEKKQPPANTPRRTSPAEPSPAAHAPTPPPPWQNPSYRQLNWCLQNYRIASDWWQNRNITGKKVKIALLGTGAAPNHSDLPHVLETYCFPDNNLPAQDLHGLGTQAAVVAAGAGKTIFGVAPEAQLLIGKIGDYDHLITPEGLVAGLNWAIGAGADIIAMLVDFPDFPARQLDILQQLVAEALQRGILLVAPVGSAGNKKPESRYPARLDGVLSVGAHDLYGQRCGFSSGSYDLDILAPGEGLLSSAPDGRAVINLKSTAIAAALTAGFLALLRQWQQEHHISSPPQEVFDLLRKTATARRSFNKGDDIEYGHGILNPIEILNQLETQT